MCLVWLKNRVFLYSKPVGRMGAGGDRRRLRSRASLLLSASLFLIFFRRAEASIQVIQVNKAPSITINLDGEDATQHFVVGIAGAGERGGRWGPPPGRLKRLKGSASLGRSLCCAGAATPPEGRPLEVRSVNGTRYMCYLPPAEGPSQPQEGPATSTPVSRECDNQLLLPPRIKHDTH